jgi:anti-anti-sigma factor
MTPGFHVKLDREGDAWTLSCGGELDVATCPRLEEAFELALEMKPSSLFLEGRDLSFVDSSGIWALVRMARRCQEESLAFDVTVSDQVRDTLSRAGIAERLLLGPPSVTTPA